MVATEIVIPHRIFNFAGQMHLDTFSIDVGNLSIDLDRYDDLAVHGLRLAMEAIRMQADGFAFWQRRKKTGRPATEERTLIIAFLIQHLFDLTFRETEGLLLMVREYYCVDRVPDHSVLCWKLSSKRWSNLLERFFRHILAPLPRRRPVLALARPATVVASVNGARRHTRRR